MQNSFGGSISSYQTTPTNENTGVPTCTSLFSSKKEEKKREDQERPYSLCWMTEEWNTVSGTPASTSTCSPVPLTDTTIGTTTESLCPSQSGSTQPSPSLLLACDPSQAPGRTPRFGDGWFESSPTIHGRDGKTTTPSKHLVSEGKTTSLSGELDGVESTYPEGEEEKDRSGHTGGNGGGGSSGGISSPPPNTTGLDGPRENALGCGALHTSLHHHRGLRSGGGFSTRVGRVHNNSSPLAGVPYRQRKTPLAEPHGNGRDVMQDEMQRKDGEERFSEWKGEEGTTNEPWKNIPTSPSGNYRTESSAGASEKGELRVDSRDQCPRDLSATYFTSQMNEASLFTTSTASRYRQYSPPLSPKGMDSIASGACQRGSQTRSPTRLRGVASTSTTSSYSPEGMSRTHYGHNSSAHGFGGGHLLSTGANNASNHNYSTTSNTTHHNNSVHGNANGSNVMANSSSGGLEQGGSNSMHCNHLTFPLPGNAAANRLFAQTMAAASSAEAEGGEPGGCVSRPPELSSPIEVEPMIGSANGGGDSASHLSFYGSCYSTEGPVPSASCLSTSAPRVALGSPAPPPVQVWCESSTSDTKTTKGRVSAVRDGMKRTVLSPNSIPVSPLPVLNVHPTAASSARSSNCGTPPPTSTATTMRTSMPLEDHRETASATCSGHDSSAQEHDDGLQDGRAGPSVSTITTVPSLASPTTAAESRRSPPPSARQAIHAAQGAEGGENTGTPLPQPPPLPGNSLFVSSRLSYLGSGREDPLTPMTRKVMGRSPTMMNSPIGSPTGIAPVLTSPHSPFNNAQGGNAVHPVSSSTASSVSSPRMGMDHTSSNHGYHNNTTNSNHWATGGAGVVTHLTSHSRGSQELLQHGTLPHTVAGPNMVHRIPGSGSSSDVTSLLRIQTSNSGSPASGLAGLENSFTCGGGCGGGDASVLRSAGMSSPHRRLSPHGLSSIHRQNTPTTPPTFVSVSNSNMSTTTSVGTTAHNTISANISTVNTQNSNNRHTQLQNVDPLFPNDDDMQSLLVVGATPTFLVSAALPKEISMPANSDAHPHPDCHSSEGIAFNRNVPKVSEVEKAPVASLNDGTKSPDQTTKANTPDKPNGTGTPPLSTTLIPTVVGHSILVSPNAADAVPNGGGTRIDTKPALLDDAGVIPSQQSSAGKPRRRSFYTAGSSSFSRLGLSAGTGKRGMNAGNPSNRYNAMLQSSSVYSVNAVTGLPSGDNDTVCSAGGCGAVCGSPVPRETDSAAMRDVENAGQGGGDPSLTVNQEMEENPSGAFAPLPGVHSTTPIINGGSDTGGSDADMLAVSEQGHASPHTTTFSPVTRPRQNSILLSFQRTGGKVHAGGEGRGHNAHPTAEHPLAAQGEQDIKDAGQAEMGGHSTGSPTTTTTIRAGVRLRPRSGYHSPPMEAATLSDGVASPSIEEEGSGPTVTFTFPPTAEPDTQHTTTADSTSKTLVTTDGRKDTGAVLSHETQKKEQNEQQPGAVTEGGAEHGVRSPGLITGSSSGGFFADVTTTTTTSKFNTGLMSLFQPPLPPPMKSNNASSPMSHTSSSNLNHSRNGMVHSPTGSSSSSLTVSETGGAKVSILRGEDSGSTQYTIRPGRHRRRYSKHSSHAPRFTINVPTKDLKTIRPPNEASAPGREGDLVDGGQVKETGTTKQGGGSSKPSTENYGTSAGMGVGGGMRREFSLISEKEDLGSLHEKGDNGTTQDRDYRLTTFNSNQLSASALVLRATRLAGGAEGAQGVQTPTSLLSDGGFHRLSMMTPTSLAMAAINYSTALADGNNVVCEDVAIPEVRKEAKNDEKEEEKDHNPLGLFNSLKASGVQDNEESVNFFASGPTTESARSVGLPSFSFGAGRLDDSFGLNASESRNMHSMMNQLNNNRANPCVTSPPAQTITSPTGMVPNAPLSSWGLQSASRTTDVGWQYVTSASIGSVASAAGFGGLFHNLQRQSENLGHLFYISDDDEEEDETEAEEGLNEEGEMTCVTSAADNGDTAGDTVGPAGQEGAISDRNIQTKKKVKGKNKRNTKDQIQTQGPLGDSSVTDRLGNEVGNRNSLSAFGAMLEPQRRRNRRHSIRLNHMNGSVISITDQQTNFYAVGPQNAVISIPSTTSTHHQRYRSGALPLSSIFSSVHSFGISSPTTNHTGFSFVFTPVQPLPSAPNFASAQSRFPLIGYDASVGMLSEGQYSTSPRHRSAEGVIANPLSGDDDESERFSSRPRDWSVVAELPDHMTRFSSAQNRKDSPVSVDRQSGSTGGIVFMSPYPPSSSAASAVVPTTQPVSDGVISGSLERLVDDHTVKTTKEQEEAEKVKDPSFGSTGDVEQDVRKRVMSQAYRQREDMVIKNTLQWARGEADRRSMRMAPGEMSHLLESFDSNLYGSIPSASSFSAAVIGNIVFPIPVGENSFVMGNTDTSPPRRESFGTPVNENVAPLSALPPPAPPPASEEKVTASNNSLQYHRTETFNTAYMRSVKEVMTESSLSPDLHGYSDSSGIRYLRFPSHIEEEYSSRAQESTSLSCESPRAPVKRFSTAAQCAFGSPVTSTGLNSAGTITHTTTTTTIATAGKDARVDSPLTCDPNLPIPPAPTGPTDPTSSVLEPFRSPSVPLFANVLMGSSSLDLPGPLTSLVDASAVSGFSGPLGSSALSASIIQQMCRLRTTSTTSLSNYGATTTNEKIAQDHEVPSQSPPLQGQLPTMENTMDHSLCAKGIRASLAHPSPPPPPSSGPSLLAIHNDDSSRTKNSLLSKGVYDEMEAQVTSDTQPLEGAMQVTRKGSDDRLCTMGDKNDVPWQQGDQKESSILDASKDDATRVMQIAAMETQRDGFRRDVDGSIGLSYPSISLSKDPAVISTTMMKGPDSPLVQNTSAGTTCHMVVSESNQHEAVVPPTSESHLTAGSSIPLSSTDGGASESVKIVPHSPVESQLPSSPRNRNVLWVSSAFNADDTSSLANPSHVQGTQRVGESEDSSSVVPISLASSPPSPPNRLVGMLPLLQDASVLSVEGVRHPPPSPQNPHVVLPPPLSSSPCRVLSLNSPPSHTSSSSRVVQRIIEAEEATPLQERQSRGESSTDAVERREDKSVWPRRREASEEVSPCDVDVPERGLSPFMKPLIPLGTPLPVYHCRERLSTSQNTPTPTATAMANNTTNSNSIEAPKLESSQPYPSHQSLNSSLPLLSLFPPSERISPNDSGAIHTISASPHPPLLITGAAAEVSSTITSPVPHILLHPFRSSANSTSHSSHLHSTNVGNPSGMASPARSGGTVMRDHDAASSPLPTPPSMNTSPVVFARLQESGHNSYRNSLPRSADVSSPTPPGQPRCETMTLPAPRRESVSMTLETPSTPAAAAPGGGVPSSPFPSPGAPRPPSHANASSSHIEEATPVPVTQAVSPIRANTQCRPWRPIQPQSSRHTHSLHPPTPRDTMGGLGVLLPSGSFTGETIHGSQMEGRSVGGGPPSVNQTAACSPVTAQVTGILPLCSREGGATPLQGYRGGTPDEHSLSEAGKVVGGGSPFPGHYTGLRHSQVGDGTQPPAASTHGSGLLVNEDPLELPPPVRMSPNGEGDNKNNHKENNNTNTNNNKGDGSEFNRQDTRSLSSRPMAARGTFAMLSCSPPPPLFHLSSMTRHGEEETRRSGEMHKLCEESTPPNMVHIPHSPPHHVLPLHHHPHHHPHLVSSPHSPPQEPHQTHKPHNTPSITHSDDCEETGPHTILTPPHHRTGNTSEPPYQPTPPLSSSSSLGSSFRAPRKCFNSSPDDFSV